MSHLFGGAWDSIAGFFSGLFGGGGGGNWGNLFFGVGALIIGILLYVLGGFVLKIVGIVLIATGTFWIVNNWLIPQMGAALGGLAGIITSSSMLYVVVGLILVVGLWMVLKSMKEK